MRNGINKGLLILQNQEISARVECKNTTSDITVILGEDLRLEQHIWITVNVETSVETELDKLLRVPGPFLGC